MHVLHVQVTIFKAHLNFAPSRTVPVHMYAYVLNSCKAVHEKGSWTVGIKGVEAFSVAS